MMMDLYYPIMRSLCMLLTNIESQQQIIHNKTIINILIILLNPALLLFPSQGSSTRCSAPRHASPSPPPPASPCAPRSSAALSGHPLPRSPPHRHLHCRRHFRHLLRRRRPLQLRRRPLPPTARPMASMSLHALRSSRRASRRRHKRLIRTLHSSWVAGACARSHSVA